MVLYFHVFRFILADKARSLSVLSKEERKRRIGELYSKVFQSEKAKHVCIMLPGWYMVYQYVLEVLIISR